MSAMDLYQAFSFVKRLTTKWKDWDAYKLGLIDDEGKTLRKAKTKEEKAAMTKMIILAKNIKKLLGKLPGGNSKFASMFAAMFLLKESDLPDDFSSLLTEMMNEYGSNEIDTSYNKIETSKTYYIMDGLLDDVIQTSGKVIVLEEAYETHNIQFYKVKDLVTREIMYLPGEVLES